MAAGGEHGAMSVTVDGSLAGIDWARLNADLAADAFDNGRSPEALRRAFEQSQHVAGDRVVGTARLLSDGVCNAYLIDVWTATPYRRRGIATRLVRVLLDAVPGQHVVLQTDRARALYETLGFELEPDFMSRVIEPWLENDGNRRD